MGDERLAQGRIKAMKALEDHPDVLDKIDKWLEDTGYSSHNDEAEKAEQMIESEEKVEFEEVKKIKDPYAQDYYDTGLSVGYKENNPGIKKNVAKNSDTDGDIESIRKQMGVAPMRIVSEKGLSEIRFISDATGMTDLFEKINHMISVEKKWNYGSPADFVKIKRGANQKFEDLEDE